MRNIFKLCLLGAAAAFIAAPASAEMWNIDFDHGTDAAGNNIDFLPNTIFSSKYSTTAWQRYDGQASGNPNNNTAHNPGDSGVQDPNFESGGTNHPGVTFTIDAWNHGADNNYYGTRGSAVGYDSRMTNGRDPDLEQSFNVAGGALGKDLEGNTIANSGYGNILILQSHENDYTKNCGGGLTTTGICEKIHYDHTHVKSDDQAGGWKNKAGDITFDFDEEVTLVKMNIFDIEEYGGKVKFYDVDEDGNETVVAVVDIPVIGDNGVGLLVFNEDNPELGIQADRMMVWLAGSGAIDNIMGDTGDTTTTIPEPATMALFGFGLAAIGFYRRRRPIGDTA